MRSIRDILGNTQRRSFRPIGSESKLVSTTGMNIRQSIAARHTPQSQLHTQFTSPGYGFSIKDVLATSPQERRQFAVKMVEYNRELQKQKDLAKAITNMDQSYKSLQQIERKKVKSIEELNRTIEDTKKANQKLEEQYKAVEEAVQREKMLQQQTLSSGSSGGSSSGSSGGMSTIQSFQRTFPSPYLSPLSTIAAKTNAISRLTTAQKKSLEFLSKFNK